MKTLTKRMIAFVVLSLFATAFALAQTSQSVTPSPVPTPPAPTSAATQVVQTPEQNVIRQLDSLVSLSNAYPFGNQAGSSNMILVIPSEQTKTEDLIAINEDMNVMSRIFEKNLEQDSIASRSMFVYRKDAFLPLIGSGRSEIQSMYLPVI